jgi:hypothetical protein
MKSIYSRYEKQDFNITLQNLPNLGLFVQLQPQDNQMPCASKSEKTDWSVLWTSLPRAVQAYLIKFKESQCRLPQTCARRVRLTVY